MPQGYITDIKERSTKFGAYHDVYVDGTNLNGGKFPPKGVKVGDYVTYQTEKNARGYETLVLNSLSKIDAPAGSAPPAAPKPSGISMDRQDVISRQAALNSALAFVDLLAKTDSLPVSKSAAAAKRADMMEAILHRYVASFYHINTGSKYELPEGVEEESAAEAWDEQE